MVRADAGGDRQLELRRLGDPLGGQVGRPEGLRDDDVGIGEFALENRILGPSLSDVTTSVWPAILEEFAQAQLAGHAAEKRRRA